MKLHVYLDTPVFCAYYDTRVTDRQIETEEFWKRLKEFDISVSELTDQELSSTPDPSLRSKYHKLLEGFTKHPVTEEMKTLATHYLSEGVFTPTMFNDALHVAVAVMTRQNVLLSWNFKHLVNRRRRAMINELNISKGLPTIEIVAPPEI